MFVYIMYIYIHIGRQGAWTVTPEHDLEQKWRRAYAPPLGPMVPVIHPPIGRVGRSLGPPPRKTSIKSTFPTKFGAALHPPLATFSTFSTFRHLGKLKTTQTPKFHLTVSPPVDKTLWAVTGTDMLDRQEDMWCLRFGLKQRSPSRRAWRTVLHHVGGACSGSDQRPPHEASEM